MFRVSIPKMPIRADATPIRARDHVLPSQEIATRGGQIMSRLTLAPVLTLPAAAHTSAAWLLAPVLTLRTSDLGDPLILYKFADTNENHFGTMPSLLH
jgi:hypothetical protein